VIIPSARKPVKNVIRERVFCISMRLEALRMVDSSGVKPVAILKGKKGIILKVIPLIIVIISVSETIYENPKRR